MASSFTNSTAAARVGATVQFTARSHLQQISGRRFHDAPAIVYSFRKRISRSKITAQIGGNSNLNVDRQRAISQRIDSISGEPAIKAISISSANRLREFSDADTAHQQAPAASEGGSILGAIALIVGTSVGAGILALPAETAPAGFLPSATVLIASWIFLSMEALLLAEVNVELLKKQKKRKAESSSSCDDQDTVGSDVLSLRSMAMQTLGPVGGTLATFVYVMLSYTLLVAYIAKAGDILSVDAVQSLFPIGDWLPAGGPAGMSLPSLPEVSPWAAGGLFSCLLGGTVYAGSTHQTDMLNRGLTATLLALFGAIIVGGSLIADWSELWYADWSQAPQMVPVVFLALVFHDLVPVLCSYLDSNLPRIRTAILLGSAVPLAMFLSWDALALSLSHSSSAFRDPLAVLTVTGGPMQEAAINAFALLAIATSFIGTALSMSEFLIEQLSPLASRLFLPDRSTPSGAPVTAMSNKLSSSSLSTYAVASTPDVDLVSVVKSRVSVAFSSLRSFFGVGAQSTSTVQEAVRAAAFLLVVLPPLTVTAAIPDAFLSASEAAGAYGMTTLYGVFPPLMFWHLMNQSSTSDRSPQHVEPNKPSESSIWRRPLGNMALAGMGACACAVMMGQAALDASLFDANSTTEVVLASGSPLEGQESLLADSLSVDAPQLSVVA